MTLFLNYQAYINVDWFNHSSTIKYLFKYINKTNNRVNNGRYFFKKNENGDLN